MSVFWQRHRVDFGEPVNKYASLCSAHCKDSCFPRDFSIHLESMTDEKMKRYLIKGSVPTRDTLVPSGSEVFTERKNRKVNGEFELLL